jgi:hypothetical protein
MTVGFKKSIATDLGGYQDMPGYEDYYLWLKILNKYKGMNLPDRLVLARVGNDMIGRRHGLTFLINKIKFQNTLLKEGYIYKRN